MFHCDVKQPVFDGFVRSLNYFGIANFHLLGILYARCRKMKNDYTLYLKLLA